MALLTDQVAALTVEQTPRKSVIHCFYCNQPGHIQRHCPVYRSQKRPPHRCFNCGKVGHIERDCWQENYNGMPGQAARHPLP